jgi:hypothetical protein
VNESVVVLGAELQPAVSMALSRPDLQFLFVSDSDVLAGWDLRNVRITRIQLDELNLDSQAGRVIALDHRWFRHVERDATRYGLSGVLSCLADEFPDWVLRVSKKPPDGLWMLKGDLFHRPDAVLDGAGDEHVEEADPYGCGNIYQRRIVRAATTLAMGCRVDSDNCALGLVRIHSEAFAREEFLMAGESVKNDEIDRRSRTFLDMLEHVGFFSMNWVTDEGGQHSLTSFRPVPRALFQLFRAGGVDLLSDPKGRANVDAGQRFIVDYHYESYR